MKISKAEESIIDARCDGLSFSGMEKSHFRHCIDQIMLRGAAICGCSLPQTEFFAGYIAEELIIFINSGYEEYTLAEVLLALRLNSKGGIKAPSGLDVEQIPFSGVCFNVYYISRILSNYKSLRDCLDRKFENQIDGY